MSASNRYPILNTYVNAISLDEAVDEIEKIIAKGVPTQHVVINECPLINADGASIVWAAKKLGVPLGERVTGIDLFQRLVGLASEKGYRIYLFGAKEEVVTKVKAIFEDRYPGIQIVGYRNGYFTEADEPQIVSDMAASGASMLLPV